MPLPNVNKPCALILMLIAALLAGCATPSPPLSVSCPQPPLPPAVTPPPSRSTYSASVQSDLVKWQQQLTGTPATFKP